MRETDYFFDGVPVERLKKVQFMALPEAGVAEELGPDELFSEYVGPYFQNQAANEKTGGELHVLAVNETINVFGMTFVVTATEPQNSLGVVDTNTMIYVDLDQSAQFEKIHVVPFQDTLPRVYEYDLFNDYLKPYFKQHMQTKFNTNDQFTFHGVQFKVVCCEPQGPARVGKNTTIYCEGVLHPSLRNLLPPELLLQLSYLPPGLQMLLLNTDALGTADVNERLMEVQEMLEARRGMSNEAIGQIEAFPWSRSAQGEDGQAQCVVCQADFEDGEQVRRLPCSHVFHTACIDEWLRRCTDCPICKTNVDRVVRSY